MTRRPAAIAVGLLAVLLGACAPAAPSPMASPSAAGTAVAGSQTAGGPAPIPSPAPSASSSGLTGSSAGPTSAPGSPAPTLSPTPSFTLGSSAFRPGGAIPRRFTCDGADVSPALAWAGVPAGTASLVLLVDDPDAGDFAHWVAYAIPAATTGLAEGAGTARSPLAQGTNDFGRVGYGGPCPPSGTHHYRFTLYALAAPLGLAVAPRAAAVRAALARADVLGRATLTATYSR
jgi:Raf kinase inhibitor-like YbhB/YbcL family protein